MSMPVPVPMAVSAAPLSRLEQPGREAEQPVPSVHDLIQQADGDVVAIDGDERDDGHRELPWVMAHEGDGGKPRRRRKQGDFVSTRFEQAARGVKLALAAHAVQAGHDGGGEGQPECEQADCDRGLQARQTCNA